MAFIHPLLSAPSCRIYSFSPKLSFALPLSSCIHPASDHQIMSTIHSHLIPEKSPIISTISGDYISVTALTDHVNIEKDPKYNICFSLKMWGLQDTCIHSGDLLDDDGDLLGDGGDLLGDGGPTYGPTSDMGRC